MDDKPMDENMCFADKGFNRCSALIEKRCEGCKFRKTRKQFMADREKYKEKELEFLKKNNILKSKY